MLVTTEDKYDGITIDNVTLPETVDGFKREIELLIESLENKKLLWIKIPIEKTEFIPSLTNLGFEFHHCDERNLTLVKKLTQKALIPTTKNFIVGVGAVVIDDSRLLVIKDKFMLGYKLPGGHIDKYETIKNALVREVLEETGVNIVFESIVNVGHFLHGQFGESNMYLVCTAKALTKEIAINDLSEIAEARWIDIDDFLNLEDVNMYNKSVVRAAIENRDLKLTDRQMPLRIAGGEVFF